MKKGYNNTKEIQRIKKLVPHNIGKFKENRLFSGIH